MFFLECEFESRFGWMDREFGRMCYKFLEQKKFKIFSNEWKVKVSHSKESINKGEWFPWENYFS